MIDQRLGEELAAEAAAKEAADQQFAIRVAAGKEIAAALGESQNVSDLRCESLAIARELGAPLAVLREISRAVRVARAPEIQLPRGRYGSCSRGRDWCRDEYGRFHDDHVVGPGKYSVGSTDGFHRRDRTEWRVRHIQVGPQTWTMAE
jgi:hypothetical protein